MIVISQNLALSGALVGVTDYPLIGWHNVVTAANVTATSEDTSYPVTNVANPATHLYWLPADESPSSDQYITIVTNTSDEIDYIAIAAHNLGTVQSVVSVEGYIGSVWTEIVEETILADDTPVLFRFTAQVLPQIRLRIQPGDAASRVAVIYCGALLTMERRIYADHVPVTLGRVANVIDHVSEGGCFLGRVQTRETRETIAKFSLLTPAWVRTYLVPFLAQARTMPFFFAWRPDSYPLEVGYTWLRNDPQPSNEAPANLMSVELQLEGVA